MMDEKKQKQIEEMAKIICSSHNNNACVFNHEPCDFKCSAYGNANDLYNAGYRKQKEGEWEFEAHYFYDDYGDLRIYATAKCSECKKAYTNPHSTVASMRVSRPENLSEYDDWEVDVEPFLTEILEMARARKDLSKFCPNCGARMRGGKNE